MGILLTQSSSFFVGGIAKILGAIMNSIFVVLQNLGIANIGLCIIIFTIITYTLMLPLTIKQQKFSRLSAIMNPEIQKIQKKYEGKTDQVSVMKMNEETKLVYEKYGVSMSSGCLSTLIQFPILFALWPVVRNIPAYVHGVKEAYMPLVDQIMATKGFENIMMKIGEAQPILISSKKFDYSEANTLVDVLYKFQANTWDTLADKFPQLSDLIASTEQNIRPLNTFMGINIAETPATMFKEGMIIAALAIPILAGLLQWISSKLMQRATASASSSTQDNAMAAQMSAMTNFMPLMSVFMCFTMPAGLGIYWIVSAIVRTVQQLLINHQLNKISIDDLVKQNMEKAAKKREKKDAVAGSTINSMAHKNVKNIEEPKRKTTSNNKVDSYKKNAKPGSLASKANMVSDFNQNSKK